MIYPSEPFDPPTKTEHWCAKCDMNVVNSKNKVSGLFFVAFGHCYSADSGQYDGKYRGVMFALCRNCLDVHSK